MIVGEFKGVPLPHDHTKIIAALGRAEPIYRVGIREVGTGGKMVYSAFLIGGAEIARGTLDQVKKTTEGMFREKVKDWSE